MRKFHSLAAVAAFALLSMSACKKESTTPPTNNTPEPTKEELLAGSSQKSWHLTKYSENGVDKSSDLRSCDMDNNYVYKSDKTYSLDNGATKCDPMEEQTMETASWWFSNDHTNLYQKYTWNGMTETVTYIVKELKANSMTLSMTYENKEYVETFTAQ